MSMVSYLSMLLSNRANGITDEILIHSFVLTLAVRFLHVVCFAHLDFKYFVVYQKVWEKALGDKFMMIHLILLFNAK